MVTLVASRQLGNSSEAEVVLNGLFEMEPAYVKFKKEPLPVPWFSYDYYFYTNEKLERAYTIEEHGKLMDLFEMVTVLFGQHEIEFMLKDGSLIGTRLEIKVHMVSMVTTLFCDFKERIVTGTLCRGTMTLMF